MGARAVIVALCAANLLAGGLAGVALDRAGALPRAAREGLSGGRRGGHDRDRWLKRFTERLGLDAMQAAKVQELSARHRQCVDEATKDVRPKLRELREAWEREFRAILTPEQAAKWDQDQQRWKAERSADSKPSDKSQDPKPTPK